MPFWLAHKCDLIFLCPFNSVIETQYPVIAMEPSMHNGTAINRKFRRMLEFWLTMAYDRFFFFEYDALCLSPELPEISNNRVYGNLFTSDQKEFQGHYFLHPPIAMQRPALEHLVSYARTVPDETDRFWDRLLGYYVEYGKIPFSGWGDIGFARNTIEPQDIPSAVSARKNGAIMYHGVKGEAVLRALTQ